MTHLSRVALIGYGYAGKTFHAPLLTAEPGLALTLVASRDAAKVHADVPGVAVTADPDVAATDDAIDLIVIAAPNDTHAPLARAALKAGKHVVIDKPFTLDLAEARELLALAERHDRLLSVFHNRRWDSDFLSVADAIRHGVAGTVTHFESHFDRFRPIVRDRWREAGGAGSGIWFDLGPHLIDQALLLFGLPNRVQADLARQRSGALSDDWAHVVLDYGEARVILHAGMLVAGGVPRFTVHGDRGSLIKRQPDGQEQQLLAGMRPGAPGWGMDDDPVIAFDADGGERLLPAVSGDQRLYYAGIAAALRGEGTNPVHPIEALAVMSVLEAAARSAAERRSVEPDFTEAERAALRAAATSAI
ncbi:oxidoreductase [Sphingomonas endolithica]|uniref:oxidoreductase n=1 Tax=Sphingomonas endolithica TaxID=2972485 RepID=UPI0021AEF2B5|nr:oxidoreductase [Sphingomonas sp. ZFBP2030]